MFKKTANIVISLSGFCFWESCSRYPVMVAGWMRVGKGF